MRRDDKWFREGVWHMRRVGPVWLYASTREWQTVQRTVVLNKGRTRTLKEAKAAAENCARSEATLVLIDLGVLDAP